MKELEYDDPIRADQLNEPGRITSQIIKLLINADLVVADLTGNNPNVYYELSLRHAVGKPVIHMAEDGTLLPFDVRDNRTIFYTMHSRVAEAARDELASQIHRVHAANYKASNPILETVGLINLERSSDPERDVLLGIVQRIENLDAALRSAIASQTLRNTLIGAGLGTPYHLPSTIDDTAFARALAALGPPSPSALSAAKAASELAQLLAARTLTTPATAASPEAPPASTSSARSDTPVGNSAPEAPKETRGQ